MKPRKQRPKQQLPKNNINDVLIILLFVTHKTQRLERLNYHFQTDKLTIPMVFLHLITVETIMVWILPLHQEVLVVYQCMLQVQEQLSMSTQDAVVDTLEVSVVVDEVTMFTWSITTKDKMLVYYMPT